MPRVCHASGIRWRRLFTTCPPPFSSIQSNPLDLLTRLPSMRETMQHSKLYALEGFELAESSENAEAAEPVTGEWFTVESEDGEEARIRLSGPRVQLESHLVPARVEIKTGGDGEPEIYARVEV